LTADDAGAAATTVDLAAVGPGARHAPLIDNEGDIVGLKDLQRVRDHRRPKGEQLGEGPADGVSAANHDARLGLEHRRGLVEGDKPFEVACVYTVGEHPHQCLGGAGVGHGIGHALFDGQRGRL
jgi:hypothetical protein